MGFLQSLFGSVDDSKSSKKKACVAAGTTTDPINFTPQKKSGVLGGAGGALGFIPVVGQVASFAASAAGGGSGSGKLENCGRFNFSDEEKAQAASNAAAVRASYAPTSALLAQNIANPARDLADTQQRKANVARFAQSRSPSPDLIFGGLLIGAALLVVVAIVVAKR